MRMVDSHAHLDAFDEKGELADLISRACAAGVQHIIAIGGSPEANRRACRLAAERSEISAAVGYDRGLAGQSPDLQDVERWAAEPGVVAVGETGLDYHYEPDTRMDQMRLFENMLDLADRRTLPVVVHSREADADTIDCLRKQKMRWNGPSDAVGVLHCFTGDLDFARALLDLGVYISFSGILTFRNAEKLREVAKALPLERLLIETDAPYLAPVPYRGKTNEPAYVVEVAEQLADLHGIPAEEVMNQTRRNCAHLFFGKQDL